MTDLKNFSDMMSGIKRWILLVIPALLLGLAGFGQISPGELAKPHAHLEGMANCTKCHLLGKKVTNQNCLDCHTELKTRILSGKGYHTSSEVKGKECISCHSDHHGRNFQIIRFDKTKFNHNLTGFQLTGAHQKKQCADCHKPGFIAVEKIRQKKFTYLGLTTECLGCHADYHQKTLPSGCSDCHGVDAFKPATKFNHSDAKFQLTGKHKDVTCIQCHKVGIKNGVKYQEFKGLRFENCSNCHTDPHAGKFGTNCTQCHSDQSFASIKNSQAFDHDRTDFKLAGKHRQVTCSSCHKTKFTNAMKFGHCTDCHQDFHKGQFAKQGVSPDCSDCHTVSGFKEFSYTLDQHSRNAFPLKGAHVAVPCFACHLRQAAATDTVWKFRNIGSRCIDCHTNIHQATMSEKYCPEGDCEKCHTESRWNKITFDHNLTNFRLEGAHASRGCRDCHFGKEKTGSARQEFKGLSVQCEHCHAEIHNKQFAINGTTDCTRCHSNTAFKPASGFDHNKTLFPLDGKHKDVACIKCHKTITEKGTTFVLYKIKEFKCENCHH